jgi:hypothetical protein
MTGSSFPDGFTGCRRLLAANEGATSSVANAAVRIKRETVFGFMRCDVDYTEQSTVQATALAKIRKLFTDFWMIGRTYSAGRFPFRPSCS